MTCAICRTDWLFKATFSPAQMQLPTPHFQWVHVVVCWLSVHGNAPRSARLTQLLPHGHLPSRAAVLIHTPPEPQQDPSLLVCRVPGSAKQKETVLLEADPKHQPPGPVLGCDQ